VSDPDLRVVLDTTAVVAYADGSHHVGEMGRAMAGLLVARNEALYVMTSDPGAYGGLATIQI
jgi:hypothetical protein